MLKNMKNSGFQKIFPLALQTSPKQHVFFLCDCESVERQACCDFLQTAFTQLIQYYHRFQKLFTQQPFKSIPARSELVNMHLIMVEMKKYKPNF